MWTILTSWNHCPTLLLDAFSLPLPFFSPKIIQLKIASCNFHSLAENNCQPMWRILKLCLEYSICLQSIYKTTAQWSLAHCQFVFNVAQLDPLNVYTKTSLLIFWLAIARTFLSLELAASELPEINWFTRAQHSSLVFWRKRGGNDLFKKMSLHEWTLPRHYPETQ